MHLKCNLCSATTEPVVKHKAHNLVAHCAACGAYIKNLPHDRTTQSDFELFFGKYKGFKVSEMNTPERVDYLRWLLSNGTILKPWQVNIIKSKVGGVK